MPQNEQDIMNTTAINNEYPGKEDNPVKINIANATNPITIKVGRAA